MMLAPYFAIFLPIIVGWGVVAVATRCGSEEPPPELLAAHRWLSERDSSHSPHIARRHALPVIDLYIHIIEGPQETGHVTDQLVSEQLKVIEETFYKFDISFNYKGFDRTINDVWAKGEDESAMKHALRKGDYDALNLYFQPKLPGFLGLCRFPRGAFPLDYPDLTAEGRAFFTDPDFRALDGCQIASFTMPGQLDPTSAKETTDPDIGHGASLFKRAEPYKGLTAIHEIGHWFGLIHTFQGDSCTGPGDLIADTRQQKNATKGCPSHRVSCPNLPYSQPPEDPVHNFMDYSDDECYTGFTPLQVRRLIDIFYLFREAENQKKNSSTSVVSANSSSSTIAPSSKPYANTTSTGTIMSISEAFSTPIFPLVYTDISLNIALVSTPISGLESYPSNPPENGSSSEDQTIPSNERCPEGLSCTGYHDGSSISSSLNDTDSPTEEGNSDPITDTEQHNSHFYPNAPFSPLESTILSTSFGPPMSSKSFSNPNPSSSLQPFSPSVRSASKSPTAVPDNRWNHTVTAYFGSGDTDIFPPSKIPWDFITHLCYAFGKTQNASANWSISVNDTLLRTLSNDALEHGVDLLLSVGGYGEGGRYFSDIVQTNASINAFVRSLKTKVQHYHLAGIDIDWEFVGKMPEEYGKNSPRDAAGYLNLIKALRASMPSLQITAAVPVYLFTSDGNAEIDMHPFVPFFDRVYLMLYDLWTGSTTAGSNAPLGRDIPNTLSSSESNFVPENPSDDYPYPNAGVDPNQNFGIEGVQTWNKAGFPIEKLIYGVPFYGYGYKLLNGSSPSTTGLYSNISSRSSGDANENPNATNPSGFWKWRNLKSQNVIVQSANGTYGPGPGWQQGYDSAGETPYVWSVNRSEIISYDDPQSLWIKYNWARSQGMGAFNPKNQWMAASSLQVGKYSNCDLISSPGSYAVD